MSSCVVLSGIPQYAFKSSIRKRTLHWLFSPLEKKLHIYPPGSFQWFSKETKSNLSTTSINIKPPNDKKFILLLKFKSACNGPNHHLLQLYRSKQGDAYLCQLTVWTERNSDIYDVYSLFVICYGHFIGFIKFQNVNKTRILKKFGCHQIILWQH